MYRDQEKLNLFLDTKEINKRMMGDTYFFTYRFYVEWMSIMDRIFD